MRLKASLYLSVAAIGGAVLLGAPSIQLRAQQGAPAGVSVGDSDLGGVVTGPNGPEAGVWVIAETTDLPTKFAKIVVTDDRGRYLHARTCRRRTTASGCAATGWSIRRRCRPRPARSST